MNQKNYPAGSVAAAGQWGKKCDVRSRASNTWLGFRRGVALFAVKAFLVNDLPVLIGLAGFELHGFPAKAADWELIQGQFLGRKD